MVQFLNAQEIKNQHNQLQEKISSQPSYFLREGFIFNFLDTADKKSELLELGCGSGTLSKELIARGFNTIHALDIDDYFTDQTIKEKLHFVTCNLSYDNIPLKDESIDTVIGMAIMEHLENPFFCITEVARILKPGGKFIFSIPHPSSLHSRLKFLWSGNIDGYREDNNHLVIFTNGVILKILNKNFIVEQRVYSHGWLKFFGHKFYLPQTHFFNFWFGTKVCYTLVKK